MTGLFLADYSVSGFLPNILTLKGRGFNTTTYSLIYGFALFMAFLGYNFYGWLSDRTGRKVLTQGYCAFLVVLGIPVFYVLYHAAIQRNLWMAVVGTVMAAMLKLPWGVGSCLLMRTFHANGASPRAHIGTVSLKRDANVPMRRQFLSRCSKNYSRLNGSRVIQSKTQASTLGADRLHQISTLPCACCFRMRPIRIFDWTQAPRSRRHSEIRATHGPRGNSSLRERNRRCHQPAHFSDVSSQAF